LKNIETIRIIGKEQVEKRTYWKVKFGCSHTTWRRFQDEWWR